MTRLFAIFMAFAFAIGAAGIASAGDAGKGEGLWASKKCKNCHNMTDKKKVGPGLVGVTKKRSHQWLVKWISDTKGTWKDGSAETQAMKDEYGYKGKRPKMKVKVKPAEAEDIIAWMAANGG